MDCAIGCGMKEKPAQKKCHREREKDLYSLPCNFRVAAIAMLNFCIINTQT